MYLDSIGSISRLYKFYGAKQCVLGFGVTILYLHMYITLYITIGQYTFSQYTWPQYTQLL